MCQKEEEVKGDAERVKNNLNWIIVFQIAQITLHKHSNIFNGRCCYKYKYTG